MGDQQKGGTVDHIGQKTVPVHGQPLFCIGIVVKGVCTQIDGRRVQQQGDPDSGGIDRQ